MIDPGQPYSPLPVAAYPPPGSGAGGFPFPINPNVIASLPPGYTPDFGPGRAAYGSINPDTITGALHAAMQTPGPPGIPFLPPGTPTPNIPDVSGSVMKAAGPGGTPVLYGTQAARDLAIQGLINVARAYGQNSKQFRP